eukprot:685563-Rhodomonas_salina.1
MPDVPKHVVEPAARGSHRVHRGLRPVRLVQPIRAESVPDAVQHVRAVQMQYNTYARNQYQRGHRLRVSVPASEVVSDVEQRTKFELYWWSPLLLLHMLKPS